MGIHQYEWLYCGFWMVHRGWQKYIFKTWFKGKLKPVIIGKFSDEK